MGGDIGLDRGLRADSAGDDVADGRGRGLEAADEACANLLLDQRMVLGKGLQRATAEEIAAAVADMGQPEGWTGAGMGLPERCGRFEKERRREWCPCPRWVRERWARWKTVRFAMQMACCRRVWGWSAG